MLLKSLMAGNIAAQNLIGVRKASWNKLEGDWWDPRVTQ